MEELQEANSRLAFIIAFTVHCSLQYVFYKEEKAEKDHLFDEGF